MSRTKILGVILVDQQLQYDIHAAWVAKRTQSGHGTEVTKGTPT